MSIDREQTTIRLPVDLKERIQRQANKKGMSFNAYLVAILQGMIK